VIAVDRVASCVRLTVNIKTLDAYGPLVAQLADQRNYTVLTSLIEVLQQNNTRFKGMV